MLSQVLQFNSFSKDGKQYVILQIHNGADVRGGYTDPQVFEADTEEFWSQALSHDVRASSRGKSYYSDTSGYHWKREADYSQKDINGNSMQDVKIDPAQEWEGEDGKFFDKRTKEPVYFEA